LVDILKLQFGDTSGLMALVWIAFIIIFSFFQQTFMVMQIIWKSERAVQMLENLAVKGKRHVLKKITKTPSKELNHKVTNFMEFFMIEPVSLDPFGIVKKIEHVVNLSEDRFKKFANEIAPNLGKEEKANLVMGMSGAISLNQIAKILRHFLEMTKKTKSLQFAFILQSNLPLVEKLAKALLEGTEAFTNGWPVGDGIGSLVAAKLIGNEKAKEMDEETLLARRKIRGRDVLIVKAKGPGGRLGKLGRVVENLVKREKISKIITIDGALKLEGEKTGSTAEGIGVAIGGIGVDRAYIENISVKKNIPLDTVVIKMSQEEAIQPMRGEILGAVDKVVKTVEDNIADTKGKIIVVGVGNTTGIGNSKKEAEESEKQIKKVLKRIEAEEKEKGKGWGWLTGG